METDRIPRCVWWTRFFGAVFSCISIKNEVVRLLFCAGWTAVSPLKRTKWRNYYISVGEVLWLASSRVFIKYTSLPRQTTQTFTSVKIEKDEDARDALSRLQLSTSKKLASYRLGKFPRGKFAPGVWRRDHFMMTSELNLEKRRKLRLNNLCREVDSLPSISEILEEGFSNITRETESLRSLLCNDIFRRLLRMVPERPESGLFFDQKPTDDEARPNWSDWRSSMEKDISF